MAVGLPFSPAHVSALVARADELGRLGEDQRDPTVLMRAARLYMLAVHVADDMDNRPAPPFTFTDLASLRDELRTLATNAVLSETPDDDGDDDIDRPDIIGDMTRAFRDVALRIEQRLASNAPRPDAELQA